MKFTKLIAALYFFLLISSSVLAVQSKTKMQTTKLHKITTSRAKTHGINKSSIISFLVGLGTQMPIIGPIMEGVETMMKVEGECSKENLTTFYTENLAIAIEKAKIAIANAVKNVAKYSVQLNLSNDEKEKLSGNESNPRQYCKTIVEIHKKKEKEAKKNSDTAIEMLAILNKVNIRKEKWAVVLKKADSTFGHNGHKLLANYIGKTTVFKNDEAFFALIQENIGYLSESGKSSNIDYSKLVDNEQDTPNCADLPVTRTFDANKETYIQLIWAGWNTLKKATMCYLKNAPSAVVTALIAEISEKFLENVIEVVAGLFGLAIKAIKILYYIIKSMYYVVKATKEGIEADEAAAFWGKSAGSGIRCALIFLHVPGAKKKLI